MKKIISLIICIMILAISFRNVMAVDGNKIQKSVASKIIRFHVIANSDLQEDQALKLKVRDKVLQYMQPKLKNSKNIQESRKILLENDNKIKKIAQQVVKKEGYTYKINTTLSNENFPVKTYGNITLPQGKYEAYRIIIGTGEGHNWWCVMFPPLCFVDITRGEVANNETKSEMKKVLSDKEYKMVDNTINNNVVLKFKIIESFKKILNN
ncbi:stage II sporulation protein R [Haloimpatiens sp. FM7330]|uniref:stage II sporulation protein R n=1 Tax=Haloimpatiens sp. FM7330 TaxID=3298610 RepID=UPI00363B8982